MTYKYCSCGQGLEEPTAIEDLGDGQECPSCHKLQARDRSTEEWVARAFEEIATLKARIDVLEGGG